MTWQGTSMSVRDPDVLGSQEEIMALFGIGRRTFKRWVRDGMPVKKEGRSYRGHRPTLMDWYARYTGGHPVVEADA